jgi:hypothetical protein
MSIYMSKKIICQVMPFDIFQFSQNHLHILVIRYRKTINYYNSMDISFKFFKCTALH